MQNWVFENFNAEGICSSSLFYFYNFVRNKKWYPALLVPFSSAFLTQGDVLDFYCV